ncbi:hypothetical protein [Aliamphritea ceti]|uniref:hypothetical protein n=1 Tax=Aliamphritea ceti TaxID=1524258 RepID=UPI0021C26B4F|nr:hypothetical protein [Aliamphritea ceti]
MIIDTSYINLSASHEKTESRSFSASLNSDLQFGKLFLDNMTNYFAPDDIANPAGTDGSNQQQDSEQDPSSSILVMTDQGFRFRDPAEQQKITDQQQLANDRLFQGLLQAVSGQRITATSANSDIMALISQAKQAESGDTPHSTEIQPAKLEVTVKMKETVSEYECTEFSSCGVVRTADGREFDLSMQLKMERSYTETREFEMTKEVTFTDPLIINFQGEAADLSDEKYSFDLDADGDQELISYLNGNGAMLALDKNNDGTINDGTELFGALTGDGFADLAQYDEDGNGYIDENDSIFADLQLWTKTVDEDKLESLADRGIGAIYLGSADTPFDIKGSDNQINGRVRATGFYLTEAGDSGAVQQVDMVV